MIKVIQVLRKRKRSKSACAFFYINLTYHCFLILQRNNKISGVKRKQNKQTQQNG